MKYFNSFRLFHLIAICSFTLLAMEKESKKSGKKPEVILNVFGLGENYWHCSIPKNMSFVNPTLVTGPFRTSGSGKNGVRVIEATKHLPFSRTLKEVYVQGEGWEGMSVYSKAPRCVLEGEFDKQKLGTLVHREIVKKNEKRNQGYTPILQKANIILGLGCNEKLNVLGDYVSKASVEFEMIYPSLIWKREKIDPSQQQTIPSNENSFSSYKENISAKKSQIMLVSDNLFSK